MPLEITRDRVAAITKAARALTADELLVGVPQDENEREDGDSIGNAAIGYISEHGAPEANIPARPWLEPGVRNAQNEIIGILKIGAADTLDGNATAARASLDAAGLAAQNSVRAKILSNIPPPLSERTIAARRRRSKGSTYRRKATSTSDVVALVDTGQFLNSVTYVLRKRGS